MTIQDWGVTYDELEPLCARLEYPCGTSGTAGNLKGVIQSGGNPFEGPRSRPYPTPAQRQPFSATMFAKAADDLGHHPIPQPSGNMSQAYTNPLGVTLGPCTSCGCREWFGCGDYSKASPQTTILPVLVKSQGFTARNNCEVLRITLDATGKRATGVVFVDTDGEEREQPADLVLSCAFTPSNVRLLMLSGVGQIHDSAPKQGTVGRDFTRRSPLSKVAWASPRNLAQFQEKAKQDCVGKPTQSCLAEDAEAGPQGGRVGQAPLPAEHPARHAGLKPAVSPRRTVFARPPS